MRSMAAADDIKLSAVLLNINTHKASGEDQALLETVMRVMVRGITRSGSIYSFLNHMVLFKNRDILTLLGE